ncbi:hypothetical protein [Shinella zoogloeoides]|uniref:Uncharacterized protein n=1 Tax=Shinella zoogloeoides TaxID=352475 RepID=A0A6N8TCY9_SHIZO|nr:hypothetical protein [Shinella zoogloeoides]MXN99073.1 hypothetical protein [Shinella zoogloeoides]UEX83504.1 hypothetical protein K8M09_09645 [Shinella zoogloeoides]
MNDHDFHRRQAYIHPIAQPWRVAPDFKDRDMLYIFSKQNFVQIAWNGKAPRSESRVRNVVLDAPLGPLGVVRTGNVG